MLFRRKNYCCSLLEEKMHEAGRRGFAIIPSTYNNTFSFFLQFRSVDFKKNKEVSNSFGQMGITYCPWCGKKFKQSINKEKLNELAEKHKHLVDKF